MVCWAQPWASQPLFSIFQLLLSVLSQHLISYYLWLSPKSSKVMSLSGLVVANDWPGGVCEGMSQNSTWPIIKSHYYFWLCSAIFWDVHPEESDIKDILCYFATLSPSSSLLMSTLLGWQQKPPGRAERKEAFESTDLCPFIFFKNQWHSSSSVFLILISLLLILPVSTHEMGLALSKRFFLAVTETLALPETTVLYIDNSPHLNSLKIKIVPLQTEAESFRGHKELFTVFHGAMSQNAIETQLASKYLLLCLLWIPHLNKRTTNFWVFFRQ